ncbi:MAG: hypothetical protein MN733_21945, partial [Nitrososphaera sp.]|nr:hypothetical protein [Nitrososphaera sp.]
PTLDVDLAATLTTTQRTDALKLPLNISTIALITISAEDAATSSCLIVQCPDVDDAAPSVTAAPLATTRTHVANIEDVYDLEVRTSAAGLVASRANVATYDDYSIVTRGFRWARR